LATEKAAAQDLGLADDVAALCRRDQVWRRRRRVKHFQTAQQKGEAVIGQKIRNS